MMGRTRITVRISAEELERRIERDIKNQAMKRRQRAQQLKDLRFNRRTQPRPLQSICNGYCR